MDWMDGKKEWNRGKRKGFWEVWPFDDEKWNGMIGRKWMWVGNDENGKRNQKGERMYEFGGFWFGKNIPIIFGKKFNNYNTNLRRNELRKDIVILRKSKEKKGRNWRREMFWTKVRWSMALTKDLRSASNEDMDNWDWIWRMDVPPSGVLFIPPSLSICTIYFSIFVQYANKLAVWICLF